MTRRTLIATLLAAILAPFRRAKAAPVVTADYWRDRMQEIVDRHWAELQRSRVPVFRVDLSKPSRERDELFETIRQTEDAPTSAIFGLCPKCGGLQCRCD